MLLKNERRGIEHIYWGGKKEGRRRVKVSGIWQSVVSVVFWRNSFLQMLSGGQNEKQLPSLPKPPLRVAPLKYVCYRGKPGFQSGEIGKTSELAQGGQGCLEF